MDPRKTRAFHKNIYFCFIEYTKAFGCMDYLKLWEIPESVGNTRTLYLSPEKPVCRSRSDS